MWKDPIVEETRRRREELGGRYDFDIKAMVVELHRQQKVAGKRTVTRPPKRVKPSAA